MPQQNEHTIAVLAPNLHLTVTIESGTDDDEVHIHPAGQGFWIARMLKHLGERPLLCGPLGGESGQVFLGLLGQWGMNISPVHISESSPVVIHDRRSGDRAVVAETAGPTLARHEVDDVYGRFLEHSMRAGLCVVTGQSQQTIPTDTYRRLAHDLHSAGTHVVADLHGPELAQFLEGGPIEVLKVSDEDLKADGLLEGDDASQAVSAIDGLAGRGAKAVVLSRNRRPAVARFGEQVLLATPPDIEPADHRGAGDSMTAGLAAAARRQAGPAESLRLACAAGAANVTRHGLGSADEDLIPELAALVEVQPMEEAAR